MIFKKKLFSFFYFISIIFSLTSGVRKGKLKLKKLVKVYDFLEASCTLDKKELSLKNFSSENINFFIRYINPNYTNEVGNAEVLTGINYFLWFQIPKVNIHLHGKYRANLVIPIKDYKFQNGVVQCKLGEEVLDRQTFQIGEPPPEIKDLICIFHPTNQVIYCSYQSNEFNISQRIFHKIFISTSSTKEESFVEVTSAGSSNNFKVPGNLYNNLLKNYNHQNHNYENNFNNYENKLINLTLITKNNLGSKEAKLDLFTIEDITG